MVHSPFLRIYTNRNGVAADTGCMDSRSTLSLHLTRSAAKLEKNVQYRQVKRSIGIAVRRFCCVVIKIFISLKMGQRMSRMGVTA